MAVVVCVSEFSASEAVELLGVAEPRVIHNGVDQRFLGAAALPPAQLRFLGVG